MAVRVRFRSESIKPQLNESAEQLKRRVQQAATSATGQAAENILDAGRDDIASAGRFGRSWTAGFTYEISGGDKFKKITFFHSNPLWRVFQFGAKIQGKPLLWIPVEPGGPRARDFPGRLFQVKRRKKRDVPLLMSADDKQVKYIGVKRVIIRRKFHLLKIIRDEAKNMRDLFNSEMQNG